MMNPLLVRGPLYLDIFISSMPIAAALPGAGRSAASVWRGRGPPISSAPNPQQLSAVQAGLFNFCQTMDIYV